MIEVSREPAQNNIGMVAWKMKIKQPEFGSREIIVIANDSTFEQGSFGPKEDALFSAASRNGLLIRSFIEFFIFRP